MKDSRFTHLNNDITAQDGLPVIENRRSDNLSIGRAFADRCEQAAACGVVEHLYPEEAATDLVDTDKLAASDGYKINPYSLPFGLEASANGNDATAIGGRANSGGSSAVAMGYMSNSPAERSIAIGASAASNGAWSTAIGALSKSSGEGSSAFGSAAASPGYLSIAIGGSANSMGLQSVAVGASAKSAGDDTVAIGKAASTAADWSIAIGSAAFAQGHGAVAIGDSAITMGLDSVALGRGSFVTDTEVRVVSVGNPGKNLYRRVTNVQDGVTPNDAVTLQQLRNAIHEALKSIKK